MFLFGSTAMLVPLFNNAKVQKIFDKTKLFGLKIVKNVMKLK